MQGVQSDEEDEDDDASLRAVADPADLLQSNAEPKVIILQSLISVCSHVDRAPIVNVYCV